MTEGGKRLREVRETIVSRISPGVKLLELEQLADSLINKSGGEAAFKRVPGYEWATCINVNEGVVHGIPSERIIQDGDVVSVDVGMIYRGWHTDTSTTVIAGRKSAATSKLLRVGREALAAAIKEARIGNRVGQISLILEQVLRRGGMSPVKTLTGHGLCRALHEFPPIPCFLDGSVQATPLSKSGMTLAIEVIYSMGEALT